MAELRGVDERRPRSAIYGTTLNTTPHPPEQSEFPPPEVVPSRSANESEMALFSECSD
jgi:hypothetical protein